MLSMQCGKKLKEQRGKQNHNDGYSFVISFFQFSPFLFHFLVMLVCERGSQSFLFSGLGKGEAPD